MEEESTLPLNQSVVKNDVIDESPSTVTSEIIVSPEVYDVVPSVVAMVADIEGASPCEPNKIPKLTEALSKCLQIGERASKIEEEFEAETVPFDAGDEGNGVSGCAGSDSGVEGCGGRALSSGGGSRSCASSVVSCGSACGSECSSLAGGVESGARTKRKVAVAEPERCRVVSARLASARAPNLATRERARSREKPTPPEKPRPLTPKPRGRVPVDLPALTRESPAPRVKATKTSAARCRTPGTPPDDSKWPFVGKTLPASRAFSESPKLSSAAESKLAIDKYATLPRRRKDPSPDSSPKRGASVTRAASTRKPPVRDRDHISTRTLPPYPRGATRARIRIYHETSAQTALLGEDVERALAGVGIDSIRTDLVRVDKSHKSVQADVRDSELERLERSVRTLTEGNARLKERLTSCTAQLEEERTGRLEAREQLSHNTTRVLAALDARDDLHALETQLQLSADVVAKQQSEINRLHLTCNILRQDAERSASCQRELEQRLAEAEREHAELQEFLSAEKAALQDALRDADAEVARQGSELARRRAECRHLVRISEQRRQEALSAQARLRGVGSSGGATGAGGGLDGLAQRLQALLDTLLASYNISREELEDVVYHNEAFSCSESSGGHSPEGAAPASVPAPRASSLLAAVVSAIKGAATSSTHGLRDDGRASDDDNSADLLDSETEPCLMMENVLEDVSMPDTHSHNLVSSGLSLMSSSLQATPSSRALATSVSAVQLTESKQATHHMAASLAFSALDNTQLNFYSKEDSCNSLQNLATFSADELSPVNDNLSIYGEEGNAGYDYSEHESLQNLSQAIINRQQSEAECSMSEDLLSHRINDDREDSSGLVDKVILVDNLLTKLLKVLRIIQLENESSVQQLNTVKQKVGESEKNIADVVLRKLSELEENKHLIEQYKQTIEKLSGDLRKVQEVKMGIEMQTCRAEAESPASVGVCAGVLACPCRAGDVCGLRGQYGAADRALQLLHSAQEHVSACPPLAQLQQQLEELCFHTALLLTSPPPPPPKPSATTTTIDSAA